MSATKSTSPLGDMAATVARLRARMRDLDTVLADVLALRAQLYETALGHSPSVDELSALAASVCQARAADMQARSRRTECCHARYLVMLRLRGLGWSLSGIGRALAVDHGTVMHGLRVARALLETRDPEFVARVNSFTALLRGTEPSPDDSHARPL